MFWFECESSFSEYSTGIVRVFEGLYGYLGIVGGPLALLSIIMLSW